MLILDIISVLPFWLVELVDVSDANADVRGGGDRRQICVCGGGDKVMKGMCVWWWACSRQDVH